MPPGCTSAPCRAALSDRDVAVFLALALPHQDEAAVEREVVQLQADHLKPSQPGRVVAFQQLQRVCVADSFGPRHPPDHVAALAARALAVPYILHRVDAQTRIAVVVERAQADEFLAAPTQLDPSRLGQPLDGDFFLQPLFCSSCILAMYPPFAGILSKTCQDTDMIHLMYQIEFFEVKT